MDDDLVKKILEQDYLVIGPIALVDGGRDLVVTAKGKGSALIIVHDLLIEVSDGFNIYDRVELNDPESLVKLKLAIEKLINKEPYSI